VEGVFALDEPLAELHAHLGGGVDAATMWELAHEQGIKLPFEDYWAFARAASVGAGVSGLDGLNAIYHLTELIQSSPEGVYRAVHKMLAGAYRSQRITTHEVRVHAADRAMLEYPIQASVTLMMDRCFTPELNAAVVDKAVRFAGRGVVAIDIGGPRPAGSALPFDYSGLAPLLARAQAAGLGVTFHAGEEGVNAPDPSPYLTELAQVVDLGVDRIGHGIIAAYDPHLAERIAERGIVLEVCPTSNVKTGAVRSEQQIAEIVYALRAAGVEVVIATDGPEMIGTRLRAEYAMLVRLGAITRDQARQINTRAHEVSFVTGWRAGT
jgi:adenosine deaminase